jgi:hypothetical protein
MLQAPLCLPQVSKQALIKYLLTYFAMALLTHKLTHSLTYLLLAC